MKMDYQKARKFMVDNQIRPNNIQNNKILELFNSIEKENFIPEKTAKLLNHLSY